MTKKFFLCIPMFLVMSLAGSLAAQQNSPPPGQGRGRQGMGGPPPVMGTITSVGVDRFEIKTTDGTQTVMVNDKTQIHQRVQGQQEPQTLALEDLKVGDHVTVRGTPNADKQVAAEMVNRISAEQWQRFQSGGGFGGGGGGGGGFGGGGGGGGNGTRAGGQILSINGNQIKVQGRQGERTIVINDQTTFSKEQQPATLKDFKVGDRIFAMGKESNGQFLATEVRSGGGRGGRGGGGGGGGGQAPPQN